MYLGKSFISQEADNMQILKTPSRKTTSKFPQIKLYAHLPQQTVLYYGIYNSLMFQANVQIMREKRIMCMYVVCNLMNCICIK